MGGSGSSKGGMSDWGPEGCKVDAWLLQNFIPGNFWPLTSDACEKS